MRRSQTLEISAILEAFLKQQGLDGKLREHRLLQSWETLLGKTVAKHTSNLYIKNKTLFVTLTSSVVRNELYMIKDELIKRLNETGGALIIEEIVLK